MLVQWFDTAALPIASHVHRNGWSSWDSRVALWRVSTSALRHICHCDSRGPESTAVQMHRKEVLRINTNYLNVLGIVPGNATLGENLELHLLAANILVPSSHAGKQLKLISCTLPPRLDAFLPSICHHPLEHYSGRHIYHGDGGWFCNGAVPQLW